MDVHRFEDALARARRTPDAPTDLDAALATWRGPAYTDVTGSTWAQRNRIRLEALRLEEVELRARLLLDSGSGAELGAHVTEHLWREPAWGLLARALHRAGRQADAPATLRRARTMLADQLGLDLDPRADLRRLETAILRGAAPLPHVPCGPQAYDALMHSRRDRLAAVQATERTGDIALTARLIGAYDVPVLWSRADDPEQSRAVVGALTTLHLT